MRALIDLVRDPIVIAILLFICLLGVLAVVTVRKQAQKRTQPMPIRLLVAISFFGALSVVLMYFKFPLIPAAPFLTYDFSDVPVLIGTFALGPVAGFFIVIIKNTIYFLTRSRSGLIGTFMNWSSTTVFILVAGIIYYYVKKKDHKYSIPIPFSKGKVLTLTRGALAALFGMILGTICFATVAVFTNIYVALPLWGIPAQEIIPLVRAAIIPFNLLRGLISTVATMLLYKRTRNILRRSLKL